MCGMKIQYALFALHISSLQVFSMDTLPFINFTSDISEVYIGQYLKLEMTATFPKRMQKLHIRVMVYSDEMSVSWMNRFFTGKNILFDRRTVTNTITDGFAPMMFYPAMQEDYWNFNITNEQNNTDNEMQYRPQGLVHTSNAGNVTVGASIEMDDITIATSEKSCVVTNSTPDYQKDMKFSLESPASIILTPGEKSHIIFKARIPYFNPKIVVDVLAGKGLVAYNVKVTDVGRNFKGAYITLLNGCNTCELSNRVRLEFPDNWKNSGVFRYPTTSSRDEITFDATFRTSTFAANDTDLQIRIFVNYTDVWTRRINVTINNTELTDQGAKIYSISHVQIMNIGDIERVVIQLESETEFIGDFQVQIWTEHKTKIGKPALKIASVNIDNVSENIDCYSDNVTYWATNKSEIQNAATITFTNFTNLGCTRRAKQTNNIIEIKVEIQMMMNQTIMGDTYVMTTLLNGIEKVIEINANGTSPIIFGDSRMIMKYEVRKITDGNNDTCLFLPVTGDTPPMLLVKYDTMLLRVSRSKFILTVVGSGISCKRHGDKLLQVSHPVSTSKGQFHGETKFCDLSLDGGEECIFNCACANVLQCSEVILFFATVNQTESWRLCELWAKNY